MSNTQISKGNTIDTNLSDYLSLLSTSKEKQIKLPKKKIDST